MPAVVAGIVVSEPVVQRYLVLNLAFLYLVSQEYGEGHSLVGDVALVPHGPIDGSISQTSGAGEEHVLRSCVLESVDVMDGMLGHDLALAGSDQS